MIQSFPSAADLRIWLSENLSQSEGIWLRFFKKGSGKKSVSYAEALDEALCFGWIDAQKKKGDVHSWLQRFCPRRPQSKWSKNNTQHVERLIKIGKMTSAGLREVEAAKADGRWIAAYDSPKNSEPPADFMRELAKDKTAVSFFKALNKANLYAITYRLQTAKRPETRKKRMKVILEMLAHGKTFH
jgi:uncharacterized protein YdeI (YjbR/CyaY-like superfamily)